MHEIGDRARAKTITVTSGKGGVGKSSITLNLGIAFARSGYRVLLVDADLNLANLDILMGLAPKHTLRDVVAGAKTLSEVLISGPGGIDLLPANSGSLDLWNLDRTITDPIFRQLGELEARYDFVLIDTAAGIAPYVIDFVVCAQDVIVVTLPEPTAMMDAYAVIKMASQQFSGNDELPVRFLVVINQVSHSNEAKTTFEQMRRATSQFLGITIEFGGIILSDSHVSQAVKRRMPVLTTYPGAPASRCIQALAGRFVPQNGALRRNGKQYLSFFHRLWNRRAGGAL